MGEIYIIFRKEMLIWIKNPMVPVVRAVVFPLLWIVIFGTAFSGTVDHIPVALVQEDFGSEAQGLVYYFNTQGVLDITTSTNLAHAYDMLLAKEVYGIIFVPPDFSDKLINGESPSIHLSVDETTPQISTTLISHIFTGAREYSKEVTVEKDGSPLGMDVIVEKNTLFGRGIEYLDFLAPGVVMMTLLFSGFFTGGLNLIMDRQVGTLRMLMVAPISKEAIILGKALAGVMQSMTSGTVALGVAMLMGVEIKSGLMGLFLIFFLMFVSGFGFIGLSLIFGSRITYLEQFMVVMMVLIMPMWFLSGGLYPLESMPEWMKVIASINPMTYATEAMRAVMLRGIIWESFAFDVLVLVVFAISMMVAGSLSFRRTIE